MISLEQIQKYGVNALMFVAIIWLNARLSEVESRLYDCMEKRATKAQDKLPKRDNLLAILPKEIKIEKVTKRHA